MTTSKRTPAVELIPVLRRPHLKNKIPLIASATLNETSEQLNGKWRGTTPQGRELMRKRLWEVERELRAAKTEFDEHWGKITCLFPKRTFTRAMSIQDRDNRERISGHLTSTEQWTAYRTSVERAATAFELIKGWPDYKDRSEKVECLKRILVEHIHVTETAVSGGSENEFLQNEANFPAK